MPGTMLMTDLAWMAVCGLSVAAMGAVYLIDRHRWRRRAHLLALQAQAATMGLECARRARRQQIDRWRSEAMTARCEQAKADGRAADLLKAMVEIHRIAAKASGLEDGDWGRPVTVGDPDVDPLYAEISLCGPSWVAVYLRRREPCIQTGTVTRNGVGGLVLWDGQRTLLATFGERESSLDSSGLAYAIDVEKITEIIRAYNQSFHQAKGVADVGAVEEEK